MSVAKQNEFVVGVDGCPGGWVSVTVGGESFTATIHPTVADLLNAFRDAAVIAVDIPIGLSMDGPRRCDLIARKLLGPRGSSVFAAPDPRLLVCPTHAAAAALARELTGKGISIQTFHIIPKIREVDRLITPASQSRVFEVHPEVAFRAMNDGQALAHAKKRLAGYEERRALLQASLGISIPERRLLGRFVPPAAPDDILDALAALWSARRIAGGTAVRLPPEPQLDASGRRMEIVY